MDKRTIKLIYLVVFAIEWYFCYIWLIKPVAPVILQLMKGTYEFSPSMDIITGATSLFRVLVQAFVFAFLMIGTTKLYKHFYVSLPNNDNSDTTDN